MQRERGSDIFPLAKLGRDSRTSEFFSPCHSMVDRADFLCRCFSGSDGILIAGGESM